MDFTDLVHAQPVTSSEPSTPSERPSRLHRILRSPLLHFIAIGGLLYVTTTQSRETEPVAIDVSSEDIAQLVDEWKRNVGRGPNDEELDRLIGQFVDDSLLIEVARGFGWDHDDPVVQRRLIQNIRFLDAAPEKSDAQVLDEAYALNMHESDIVVRRRLLERVRLVIADRARSRTPSDEQLETYLRDHAEDFMRPIRVRLTQVHLSRDRRRDTLHTDAKALVASLSEAGLDPSTHLDEIVQHGDPFLLQPRLPLWSKRRLGERLGPAFAEATVDLPIGEWSGPVVSSYGEHAVWVHERREAELPALAEIRDKVMAELHREWEGEALRSALTELRSQVEVRIATGPGDRVEKSATN